MSSNAKVKFAVPDNHPLPLAADDWLRPFAGKLTARREAAAVMRRRLTGASGASLAEWASGHEYYGLHRTASGRWIFREWAPHATAMWLIGDFSGWRREPAFACRRLPGKSGDWELELAPEILQHGMHYQLFLEWPEGNGVRLPAYGRYIVQDERTHLFSAMVWAPENPYCFRHEAPPPPEAPLIYESHVGMAQERPGVGTFREYRENILPRIAAAGYNTVQLMAIMSHPYYGSFGYHVANFFSISSRFGTPDEFKELVDAAHALGLRVIIDLVHSHAVKNEVEGLGRFDGTRHAYFHEGGAGEHAGWDSLLFNYSKPQVLHFLLSNCRFWLDEYRLDGYRFDGVTSMLYLHHGLGKAFTTYDDYFGGDVNREALTYLALANEVIHEVRPDAMTIAEDVSGMPGLAAPQCEGGCGFDYRLAMGVTDMWFKLFDQADEHWSPGAMYAELTNRRRDEKTISYVECHDQAIVGGQTAIFRLAGAAMYDAMNCGSQNLAVDRAVALHKLTRLLTAATAGHGYLNFMGNEFGHPEWVDFPREGNQWSYWYARRQWSLADNPFLRYHGLREFDRAMLYLLGGNPDFYWRRPQLIRHDELGKILIFERDQLFFFFNFHPTASVEDYAVELPVGEYQPVLDSDGAQYGGFSRIAPEQRFVTQPIAMGGGSCEAIRIYLPCRSALVLRRVVSAGKE